MKKNVEKEKSLWEQVEIQYEGFLQYRTELVRVRLPDYRGGIYVPTQND